MIRHLAALLFAALTPSLLAGQRGWALDLSAGRALHNPIAAQDQIGTNNLMLGLRYDGGRPIWSYLAGGLPLGAEDTRWGTGGLGGRIALEREAFSVGLELGSHLYSYADALAGTTGGGATLELLPGVLLQQGMLGLEVHSGLVQHTAVLPEETTTRRVHDSGGRVILSLSPALAVMGEARYLRAPEGSYPYAGGTAQLSLDRGSVWAAGGRWLDDDIPTPVYGLGGNVRLSSRLELRGSWQQEASDPLYWNSPRTTWIVGVSHQLGRSRERVAPLYPRTPDGQIIIRIPLQSSPTAPYLMGDFTNWQPVPMVRSGQYWMVALAVAPGVYRYGFRREDGTWFIPSSVPGQVDDDMGGTSAVLIVP